MPASFLILIIAWENAARLFWFASMPPWTEGIEAALIIFHLSWADGTNSTILMDVVPISIPILGRLLITLNFLFN
jgi:hypothetical protein